MAKFTNRKKIKMQKLLWKILDIIMKKPPTLKNFLQVFLLEGYLH